jgi:Trm5-related predicted tRNA methylase
MITRQARSQEPSSTNDTLFSVEPGQGTERTPEAPRRIVDLCVWFRHSSKIPRRTRA